MDAKQKINVIKQIIIDNREDIRKSDDYAWGIMDAINSVLYMGDDDE